MPGMTRERDRELQEQRRRGAETGTIATRGASSRLALRPMWLRVLVPRLSGCSARCTGSGPGAGGQ
jgi:hypothetical protein